MGSCHPHHRASRRWKRYAITSSSLILVTLILLKGRLAARLPFGEVQLVPTKHEPKKIVVSDESSLTVDSLGAPFLPVRFLKQYIEGHSHQVLLSEFEDIQANRSTHSRKYAVAYYWCPQRAGNILHSYFNSVVWSMIHNRTILWAYYGNSSQEHDCQEVLKRAAWIPAYEEWKSKLELTDPTPVSNLADSWNEEKFHQVVLYPQIPDVFPRNKSIFRNAWSDHPKKTKAYLTHIQQIPLTYQESTTQLYSAGVQFLYGMLYSELFSLQQSTYGPNTLDTTDGLFSIAIHSRHTVGADDGSYIPHETECLEHLLSDRYNCSVYLMSDRPKTIVQLTDWLQQRNCSVHTADHATGKGPVLEHGPWAGAGYLEDLDLSAHAMNGVIGDPHRSSTALLIDLVEYRRRITHWKRGDSFPLASLEICKLPDKPLAGYDYGPGTPTFRHHSYLQPLAPIRAVNSFVASDRNETFVVASIDLSKPTGENIYSVLNSFIVAILMKRRLIVDTNRTHGHCEGPTVLGLREWQQQSTTLDEDEADILKMDVRELFMVSNTTEQWSAKYIQLHFERSHYDQFFWNTSLQEETAASATVPSIIQQLNDLYAYGKDLLYGLLFHELFSFCPYPSLQSYTPQPSSSIVLHMEVDTAPSTGRIQECILNLLDYEDEKLKSEPSSEKSCHLFILSDSPVENEAAFAPLVLGSGENARLTVSRDLKCSLSFYPAIFGGSDPSSLLPWKGVEETSSARGGWIGPSVTSISKPDGSVLNSTASLVRERLEYKRQLEIWKQGRDPFVYTRLPTCIY